VITRSHLSARSTVCGDVLPGRVHEGHAPAEQGQDFAHVADDGSSLSSADVLPDGIENDQLPSTSPSHHKVMHYDQRFGGRQGNHALVHWLTLSAILKVVVMPLTV